MRNVLAQKEPVVDDSFPAAVRDRYNSDEVIRIGMVVLLILLPGIIEGILNAIGEGTFGGIELIKISIYHDEWSHLIRFCNYIIIATITCRMHSRLYDHSVRDRIWRRSLIKYARGVGADTREMENVDADIRGLERFTLRAVPSVLKWTMVAFSFYCTLLVSTSLAMYNGGTPFIVRAVIDMGFANQIEDAVLFLAQWIPDILLLMIILFCAPRALTMPCRHEVMQCRFTRAMSEALARRGIRVPPMTNVVKHTGWRKHLVLTVITLGIYLLFLFFVAIRSGNNHIINQWAYEDELVKRIRGRGSDGFGKETVDASRNIRELEFTPESAVRETDIAITETTEYVRDALKVARRTGRMPFLLAMGELFIIAICTAYILRSITTSCEFYLSSAMYLPTLDNMYRFTPAIWVKLAMVMVNMAFMSNAICTLIGIASKRPSSWRAVVRNCFSFVIPAWMNAYAFSSAGLSHLVNFNPMVTTAVLFDVLLLMLMSVRIKKFYYPPDEEIPRVTRWMRYAVAGCLTIPWRGLRKECGIGEERE